MKVNEAIKQYQLSSRLNELNNSDFVFINNAVCQLFVQGPKGPVKIVKKQALLNHNIIEMLKKDGHWPLYATDEGLKQIESEQQKILHQMARSLSIGEPLINSTKLSYCLCKNLEFLYQDPMNDKLLKLQIQGLKNLTRFLMENPPIIFPLYNRILSYKYQYQYTHPLLSSILLCGFLIKLKVFNQRNIEQLFLTNYFKDIGMSLIPEENFSKKQLSKQDINLIDGHPLNSKLILDGRLGLSAGYLNIINNHHHYKFKSNYEKNDSNNITTLIGMETILINIMDALVAMTSPRPYQDQLGFYSALEKIKPYLVKDFSQEFRGLVTFLSQNF